jgi:hypothetical protein
MRAAIPFALLFIAGCSRLTGEDADVSESNLSTKSFDEACSTPLRSDDGKYLALDVCPKDGSVGKVVRIELATGTAKEVATYPAADRVDRLVARGKSFAFGVRHATSLDVHVHDWALAGGRTIAAKAPNGVAGTFNALGTLELSATGSHVAFAAADGALSKYLLVAPATGAAAPTALDLDIAAGSLRWSVAGSSLVGHQPDAGAWTGETLVLVDLTAGGATLAGKRHSDWTSSAFGEGGAVAQAPFDGSRVIGLKRSDTEGSIGTTDPRTGAEKVLDKAPVLRLVSDLAGDVIYSIVTEGEGTFTRSLVKQPRAGGTKTVLVKSTATARDDLLFGFEPLALAAGGFGVFYTATGGATASDERWLVKLDGTGTPEKLDPKVTILGTRVGTRLLVSDDTGPMTELKTLDLMTGTYTTLGAHAHGGPPSTLTGDGSVIELDECNLADGNFGLAARRIAPGRTETLVCTSMPWAATPVAAGGSGALVYYSAWGDRYTVGIVNP